jgi:hypothetical protein
MIFATLAALAVLMSMALPAASQDVTSSADMAGLSAFMPHDVMFAVSAGSVSGGNATFTVPYSAKVYKMDTVDYGAVTTFSQPLQGMYNVSSSRGQISTVNALPATIVVDQLNNSSIPVAGTNAVVALRNITNMGAAKGKFTFQFKTVSVYMPNGTAKTYNLNKPVKVSYAVDQNIVTTQADPAFTRVMSDLFITGGMFPADAQPVRLNAVLAAR